MTKREIEQFAKDVVRAGVADLPSADIYEDYDGQKVRSTFLGTVFGLMPSGKYYTPIARSNVEPCPRCKGSGKSKTPRTCNRCKGTRWISVYELASLQSVPVGEIFDRCVANGVPFDHDKTSIQCWVCEGSGQVFPDCGFCQGLGSREGLEDEWMNEALEHEAARFGCYIFSGEGDPCDIFLGQIVEECPTCGTLIYGRRLISDASESEACS